MFFKKFLAIFILFLSILNVLALPGNRKSVVNNISNFVSPSETSPSSSEPTAEQTQPSSKPSSELSGQHFLDLISGSTPEARVFYEKFKVLNVIDKGGNGIVYRGRDRNQRMVAIKFEIALNKSPMGCVEEADIMVELMSKGILKSRIYDCGIYKGLSWIVMDYITKNGSPTTLYSYLYTHGKLGERAAIRFLHQLADMLVKMRNIGIAHNDIKDSNILFNDMNAIELIDFGAAKRVRDINSQSHGIVTTYIFAAPEQLEWPHSFSPFANDVWSLGVVLFKMLHNKYPFDIEENPIGSNTFTGNYNLKAVMDVRLKPVIQILLYGMLERKLEYRWTMVDVLNHISIILTQLY